MTDVAVQVENLSKLYYIAHLQRKQSARQVLAKAVTTPFRRAAQLLSGHAAATSDMDEPFWALKDVSFEVKHGEVLGIIGRNGAGKSTLLKILSRITEPTSGRAVVHGRMGSLLEVGTGFHPDLTGRENVFLNGTMLGMSRTEVARKFDEIVAFAEIERFIDTPVKNYSSGMYTRLAFAVAAHLEPEILVCDEVLAVGDMAFQNKCLGKMGEVSKHGRTVLFVSHNMGAVTRLCTCAVWLEQGQLRQSGRVSAVVSEYVRQLDARQPDDPDGAFTARVEFLNAQGSALESWRLNEDMIIQVEVAGIEPLPSPAVDVAFYSPSGIRVFAIQSDRVDTRLTGQAAQRFAVRFRVRNVGINCDQLHADVGVRARRSPEYVRCWERLATVPVEVPGSAYQTSSDTLVVVPCTVEAIEVLP